MPLLRQQTTQDHDALCVFVDDAGEKQNVNGHRCMTGSEFLSYPAERRAVTLAVGDLSIRRRLVGNFIAANVSFVCVKEENCVVPDDSVIGEGPVLCGFSTITSKAKIGRHLRRSIHSYVARDCVIGGYVTFGPSVMCNENVHVQYGVYIGTGPIIGQGRPDRPLVIEAGAIVDIGAVVTKDVPPDTAVVGNPARTLIKQ
jgi:acetyltransferase-like isoleucine patch superfamily enzyme